MKKHGVPSSTKSFQPTPATTFFYYQRDGTLLNSTPTPPHTHTLRTTTTTTRGTRERRDTCCPGILQYTAVVYQSVSVEQSFPKLSKKKLNLRYESVSRRIVLFFEEGKQRGGDGTERDRVEATKRRHCATWPTRRRAETTDTEPALVKALRQEVEELREERDRSRKEIEG